MNGHWLGSLVFLLAIQRHIWGLYFFSFPSFSSGCPLGCGLIFFFYFISPLFFFFSSLFSRLPFLPLCVCTYVCVLGLMTTWSDLSESTSILCVTAWLNPGNGVKCQRVYLSYTVLHGAGFFVCLFYCFLFFMPFLVVCLFICLFSTTTTTTAAAALGNVWSLLFTLVVSYDLIWKRVKAKIFSFFFFLSLKIPFSPPSSSIKTPCCSLYQSCLQHLLTCLLCLYYSVCSMWKCVFCLFVPCSRVFLLFSAPGVCLSLILYVWYCACHYHNTILHTLWAMDPLFLSGVSNLLLCCCCC